MTRPLLLAFAVLLLAAPAAAQPRGGWDAAGLAEVEAYVARRKPTAFLIRQDGHAVAQWGDPARKVNVHSVRKSLIGALYGIAVGDGRIDPDATLGALGIDDRAPSLDAREKTARVRDLLAARSGIYHRAAYETAEMRDRRPARGSAAPGARWFYNNWDFNALGTIYRQRTGEDIFESFQRRIAGPVGMEDFDPAEGKLHFEPVSDHPAYLFRLSARDAARFGQLFLDRGRWGARQIVPADWVALSLAPHSISDRGDLGYGYLWWTLPADRFGPGAAFASGNGGQAIVVVPSRRLVVVQIVAAGAPERFRTSELVRLLAKIVAAAP